MSRLYFSSPSGSATLAGSEFAHLGWLASGPGRAAWGLDGVGAYGRAVEIMSLVPEPAHGGVALALLHQALRVAQTPDQGDDDTYAAQDRLVGFLSTELSGATGGLPLLVAGHGLFSRDLMWNTALAAGSPPIQLAAKVFAWAESHCWVEGRARAWLADLIDRGLDTGLYRRYPERTGDSPVGSPSASHGWEDVQAFLRSRDDEPVVLWYSAGVEFPTPNLGWMPDLPPEREDDSPEREQVQREERFTRWCELDAAEQWRISLPALREQRPGAQLAPDTLGSVTFGPPVTVYDLFAADRDDRVRAAMARYTREASAEGKVGDPAGAPA